MGRLINADALAKKLKDAIEIGKRINKPTEELEATLDCVNHMTTVEVDLLDFERMTDKNFESCFECIHSDDSEDMCILRQCIHAVGAFKECYEPKKAEREQGKWVEDDDGWDGVIWRCSECNALFTLTDGTPEENEYHFCPKCGAEMDINCEHC